MSEPIPVVVPANDATVSESLQINVPFEQMEKINKTRSTLVTRHKALVERAAKVVERLQKLEDKKKRLAVVKKPAKVMTAEQKKALVDRLAAGRAKKKSQST
jgi:hypothetical protein